MLKNSGILSIAAILVIGMYSCEPETVVPDQNRVYPSYTIEYNHSLDKTSACATFFLDEESEQIQQRHELNHPAKVEYNGDELIYNSVERYYHKDFVGLMISDFVYTNFDGYAFTNGLTMVDSVMIMLPTDSIDMQSNYNFEVLGSEPAANESIIVEVESLESGQRLESTYNTLLGLTIQITSEQIQLLGAGDFVIKVNRKKEDSNLLQANTVGGEMDIIYSVQDTVTIY